MKKCRGCGIEKPLTQFHNRPDSKDGKRNDCVICESDRKKEWHFRTNCERRKYYKAKRCRMTLNEKAKLKAYQKAWSSRPEYRKTLREKYVNNRAKNLAWQRKHREAHRKELTRKSVEYRARRLSKDPSFKLSISLRTRVRDALRYVNAKKGAKTQELIGCSRIELMEHIQKLFKPGMNWNNRNLWHIDHIRPCCSFNLLDPEEQQKCFHYTNLQPLWVQENLKKGSKIIAPGWPTATPPEGGWPQSELPDPE